MTENRRFLKYILSEKARWLRRNHPNAFLLLSLIAERAMRKSDNPGGLEIGEAKVGDFLEAGLSSRKSYRHALDTLFSLGIIQKIFTSKAKCEKRATGRATVGTYVKLLDSEIWDINPETEGHCLGHRGATEGPLTKVRPLYISKERKERKERQKPSAIASELSEFFYQSLLKNKPDLKKPNLIKWAESFEKIINLDSRDVEKTKLLINWAIQDDFWKRNILSPDKLRKHFDLLDSQMEGKKEEIYRRKNLIDVSQAKEEFGDALKHIKISGDYVLNTSSGKEISLRVHPQSFGDNFAHLAGLGVKHG